MGGAEKILEAKDKSATPFLDTLLECRQKAVVSTSNVQSYLSDVWVCKKYLDKTFPLFLFYIYI